MSWYLHFDRHFFQNFTSVAEIFLRYFFFTFKFKVSYFNNVTTSLLTSVVIPQGLVLRSIELAEFKCIKIGLIIQGEETFA